MKKNNLVFIIAITILLYSCGNSSNNENNENKEIDWSGSWEYFWDGGENVGGTPIWASYVLTIDGEDCKIEADGYQLGCHLSCRGEDKGAEYVIFYKNVIDDLDISCDDFDKTEPLIILTEKNGFLKIKESQLYFPEDISEIVFERTDVNTTSNTEANNKTTDPIELIRERFKIINDNISSYSTKSASIEQSEGGDIIGYYDGSDLKKIAVKGYGSMGYFTFEYYFWDGELFFLFETDNYYDIDEPMSGEVTQKIERRYYINNSKIIKWLDNDKKEVSSSEFKEAEESINERVISLKSEL